MHVKNFIAVDLRISGVLSSQCIPQTCGSAHPTAYMLFGNTFHAILAACDKASTRNSCAAATSEAAANQISLVPECHSLICMHDFLRQGSRHSDTHFVNVSGILKLSVIWVQHGRESRDRTLRHWGAPNIKASVGRSEQCQSTLMFSAAAEDASINRAPLSFAEPATSARSEVQRPRAMSTTIC